jgi:RND family efflux transporter MFP subunit
VCLPPTAVVALWMGGAALALAPAGCVKPAGPTVASTPLEVFVANPVEGETFDYVDYTAQLKSVQSVDIRARVSGYLMEMAFTPDTEVKKGQKLFQIDDRPFQAILTRARSQVRVFEASLLRSNADLARAKQLLPAKAITTEEYDKMVASQAEAAAQLDAAKAEVEEARLNVEFTTVTSPIDGLVSRERISVGNLIAADQTLLTTVVSRDPIYAYFNVDERTLQLVRQAMRDGKLTVPNEEKIEVSMELETEKGFPHKGFISFVDNKLKEETGTLEVRATFPNPELNKGGGGRRLLSDGYFCRVRVPLGNPHRALSIPEAAIGRDLGDRFVYVVNPSDRVERRTITVGRLEGKRRVVLGTLAASDRVIVRGIQRVQVKDSVKPIDAAEDARPAPAAAGSASR